MSRRAVLRILMPVACSIAAGALPSAVVGQITLSQDFDSGSLDVPASSVTGNTVTLVGRRTWTDPFYDTEWRWLHFEASGVSGVAPTFRITSSNFLGSLSGHRFVYSYDRQNWSYFDSGSTSGGIYTFAKAQPFTQDTVYVAYHLPYPVSRTAAHTMSIAATSPYVTPAPSTGGDYLIGQSAPGIDDSGRPVPPLDLYAYRVTDAAATNVAKKRVILAGGNHSGEPMGNFILEGAVNWMLDNTARAALLRRHADTFVYPQVNPSGRWAGYYRSNPENPDKDFNRYWNNPAGFTDLAQVRSAMTSDVAGDADYIIDFHSFFDQGGDFVNVTSALANSPFMVALRTYEPGISAAVSSGVPGMLRIWGATTAGLNAEFAYTPEIGPKAFRTEAQALSIGASHAKALFDAIVPPTVKAWEIDGDGVWSLGTNWVHGTPDSANHDVYLGAHVTAPHTITMDAARTAGSLTFDSEVAYTIGGPSTLTLGGAIDVIRGDHRIDAPLALAANSTLGVRRADDLLSIRGALTAAPGVTVTKTGAGGVEVPHVRASGLNIAEGLVRVRPDGTSAGVSVLQSLDLTGGASPTITLDLTDNALVLDYSAGASPIDLVADQIASAYAGGTWTGPGITSSLADASHFALGYGESAALFTSFPATFLGQGVDDSAVLIRFTRYGDANLDALVNLDDFNRLAQNFGQTDRFWHEADFDFDGVVNLNDFNLLAANFGLSAAGPDVTPQDWAALASAVPEPAAGMGLLLSLLIPLSRRWRSPR